MPHSDTPSERPSSQEPVVAGGQLWFKFSDVWNTRWWSMYSMETPRRMRTRSHTEQDKLCDFCFCFWQAPIKSCNNDIDEQHLQGLMRDEEWHFVFTVSLKSSWSEGGEHAVLNIGTSWQICLLLLLKWAEMRRAFFFFSFFIYKIIGFCFLSPNLNGWTLTLISYITPNHWKHLTQVWRHLWIRGHYW